MSTWPRFGTPTSYGAFESGANNELVIDARSLESHLPHAVVAFLYRVEPTYDSGPEAVRGQRMVACAEAGAAGRGGVGGMGGCVRVQVRLSGKMSPPQDVSAVSSVRTRRNRMSAAFVA